MLDKTEIDIEKAKMRAIKRLEKLKEKALRKGDVQKIRQHNQAILNLMNLRKEVRLCQKQM